jgi:predicted small secreted protein
MLKKILLIALLSILTVSLLSCQTLEGLGKDLEWIGQQLGSAVE